MFVKKITKRDKVTKNQYVTYRLVQSYRLAGKPRHRNVLDLGTLPGIPVSEHKALANRIEELLLNDSELFPIQDNKLEQTARLFYKKLLQKFDNPSSAISAIFGRSNESVNAEGTDGDKKQAQNFQEVDMNTFDNDESKNIGAEWLCKQAIDEIDLAGLLKDKLGFSDNKYALAMLALIGRLVYPGSDNKTADFLNENSGAGYFFRREDKIISRKQLSQISDELYSYKDEIERYLISRFRNLFNYKPCLLIYDLTNTHFEGRMQSSEKAGYGKNKQKRNDCPQITIALAIDEHGFAQHSRFYDGNIGETTTLEDIINDLNANIPDYNESFASTKPLIIMDAGIASEKNLVKIYKMGYDYMVVSRSEHTQIRRQVNQEGLITFKNKAQQDIHVQSFNNELKYQDNDLGQQVIKETLLYVRTPEKKQKEDSIINNKRKKFEEELAHFKKSINKLKTGKKAQDVYERIGRLKERYKKVHSCYQINLVPSTTDSNKIKDIEWEHVPANKKEQESGSYFIRTTLCDAKEQEIWQIYHKITEVEALFRILKEELKIRPVFHQLDGHIESHLFVCILALQVVLFIKTRLRNSGINYSWKEIMRIMQTQSYNTNMVERRDGANIIIRTCTRPTIKVRQILQAMSYKLVPFYRKITIIEQS
jgi:transposase